MRIGSVSLAVPAVLALTFAGCGSPPATAEGTPPSVPGRAAPAKVDGMEKYVSTGANFVVYKPVGWTVAEQSNPGGWSIIVDSPGGVLEAGKVSARNQFGDAIGVLAAVTTQLRQQSPDLRIENVHRTPDGQRAVYDFHFTHRGKGPREGRAWITIDGDLFNVSLCETPEGKLESSKALLLSILSNIRIMQRGFEPASTKAAPRVLPLREQRLPDGSAMFLLPEGWTCQALGPGQFFARNPQDGASFMVATVDVMSPRFGVRLPNVPVSGFLEPAEAWPFLTRSLVGDIQYVETIPRRDIDATVSQVYTVGPVRAAELLYTFVSDNIPRKGYTFGVSLGTRLDTGWKFWHMTLTAPAETFDAYVPTLTRMAHSYRIDDQFARSYIAQGMARLRQLEQQTRDIVTRNAQEIHSMMQAAYDERQRSNAYIDYQRTNYIRGEQDWISSMEGGTVYHTDSWGTRNTYTGETWEGAPFDYVHFDGTSKYGESMIPVNSRELWEHMNR